MYYVRWKRGTSRRCRVFAPLALDNPSALDVCYLCDDFVGTLREVRLIAIGPTSTDAAQDLAAGKWVSAGAVLVHADCGTRAGDAELDEMARSLRVIEVPDE